MPQTAPVYPMQQAAPTPAAPVPSGGAIAPGLNPTAVTLTRAIRQVESGGNYQAKGASGEFGAYQWMPGNFQNAAKTWLGDSNAPMNAQNQDKVAYYQVKSLLDKGYTQSQVASMWNSGSPEWQGKVGVNKYGVKYDVPAYVSNVQKQYQSLIGGQNQNFSKPQPGGPDVGQPQQQQSGGGLLQGLVDYGLPIAGTIGGGVIGAIAGAPAFGVGALAGAPAGAGLGAVAGSSLAEIIDQLAGWKQRTPVQAALEPLAMGAATAATGGAGEALGALTGVGGLAARTGAQAAIGGAYGAAQTGLEGGDMKQGALTGALFGGATNVAGEGLGAGLNALANRTPEGRLNQLVGSLTSLGNADEKFSSPLRDAAGNVTRDASGNIQFQNPSELLAQEKLIPFLRVEDGKVQTDELAAQIDNKMSTISDEVTQRINSIAGKTNQDLGGGVTLQGEAVNGVSMQDFRNAAVQKAMSDSRVLGTGDINKVLGQIDSKIAGLATAYGTDVPWTDVNNIRVQMNKVYNPDSMDVERILGDTARDQLYSSSGDPELKALLAKEGQLIQTQDFVKRLQGKAIRGGRLGKYAAEGVGGLAGLGIGASTGGIGAGLGTLGGAYVGDKVLTAIQGRYFSPIGANSGRTLSNFMGTQGAQLTGQAAKIAALRALLNGSSTNP